MAVGFKRHRASPDIFGNEKFQKKGFRLLAVLVDNVSIRQLFGGWTAEEVFRYEFALNNHLPCSCGWCLWNVG